MTLLPEIMCNFMLKDFITCMVSSFPEKFCVSRICLTLALRMVNEAE